MKYNVIIIFLALWVLGCNDAVDENERSKSTDQKPTINSKGEFVTGRVAWSQHTQNKNLMWGSTSKLYFRVIDDQFNGSISASVDFANIELTSSEPDVVLLKANRYYVALRLPDAMERSEVRITLFLTDETEVKTTESICLIALNLGMFAVSGKINPGERDKDFNVTGCNKVY